MQHKNRDHVLNSIDLMLAIALASIAIGSGCAMEAQSNELSGLDAGVVAANVQAIRSGDAGGPSGVVEVEVPVREKTCTGSLLAPNIVLTAKHCTLGMSPSSIVVSGSKACKVFQDPTSNDLSIVRLETPVSGTPLALSNRTFQAPAVPRTGTPLTVVGFGSTGPDGVGVGTQRSTTLTFLRYDRAASTEIPSIVSDVLRLTPPLGRATAAACGGDSGGPVLDSGRIVGVISAGTAQCDVAAMVDSGAVRLDTRIPWLNAIVDIARMPQSECPPPQDPVRAPINTSDPSDNGAIHALCHVPGQSRPKCESYERFAGVLPTGVYCPPDLDGVVCTVQSGEPSVRNVYYTVCRSPLYPDQYSGCDITPYDSELGGGKLFNPAILCPGGHFQGCNTFIESGF
jgi:hypothetical protein